MAADGTKPAALRVDGGMAANNFFLQRLSDILDMEVIKPEITETTAFGAACLAGLGAGVYGSLDDIAAMWKAQASFRPAMDAARRDQELKGWRRAVEGVRHMTTV
jgi:glycerol kinase